MACTSPNNYLAAYDPEWDFWSVKKKRCSSAPRPWEARSRLRDILASASSVKRQNSIGVGRRVWIRGGGRRAPTSTWCLLGTLRETVWLSLSARRSSTTRLSTTNDASKRRKTISEPQETPNIRPQYRKEVVSPFNFTVSEIDEYAMETRIRRNGYAQIIINDRQQHRTYCQEHNIFHQQRVDAPKSDPPNLKKHQTYSPSTERNLCPLSTYAPWVESGLGLSTFLPDNSLRNQSVGSTRQRHGLEGTDTTETATE
ncbi:uncharacterized protein BDCG_01502 [Blastomyces dermatitidis ER-3]|uniref:Uncharacterized protein n=1 Tax=Ajellomyces dermatitidis (strain ER-3 / ATCC MYA-2586) TaxID=559297 RepID=A0ABP2ERR1_AJEDR|nr:uncharacterized protein BDCG_01502 [Blastomyces dermatitidis ER-3]EEQ86382.1 hypothetical protein BDCG_01502 [Blastomyces dermatitidis ER-3]